MIRITYITLISNDNSCPRCRCQGKDDDERLAEATELVLVGCAQTEQGKNHYQRDDAKCPAEPDNCAAVGGTALADRAELRMSVASREAQLGYEKRDSDHNRKADRGNQDQPVELNRYLLLYGSPLRLALLLFRSSVLPEYT